MGKITSKDHGVNENVLSILNRILNISQQQILMHIDSMKRIFTICMMLGQMLLVTPKKLLAEEGAWIKSSPADVRVERVETTHWGIMAGEFDARVWKKPFNGILISKDLGESWKQVGLDERGVTDLDYKDGIIYATTYYFVDSIAGLFVSNDGGKNWEHKADNFSTSAVNTLNDTVILGTYSHGLWVSKDKGESWHQKLGDGYFGPKIYTIAVEKGIALASSENLTYVSYDLGSYWSVLPSLGGLKVRSITILEDMIFVGTANSGMYKSVDFGQTFSKVQSWESKSVGAINYYKGVLYASGKTTAGKYKVYSSTDFGKNWQDTNLNQTYNEGNINDLGFAFSTNQYLFATVPFDGLYKYTIPPPPQQIQPFLQIPWDAQSTMSLLKEYSHFLTMSTHYLPILII